MESAKALGREIVVQEVRRSPNGNVTFNDDIEKAFASFVERRVSAITVPPDVFFTGSRGSAVIEFAARYKLPAVYGDQFFTRRGGLMSYAVSLADGYRQVGVYAGRVLKGDKPGDLPIYQAVKFEFVINLKTARDLGLQVPPMLSALADEVIE